MYLNRASWTCSTKWKKGTCHYGVVPVENSIEGAVNYTLDLFFESEVKICAELYQPISHDLLCKHGSMEDIKEIYSHPQPFGQCRRWLQKYMPNAVLTRMQQHGPRRSDSH